MCKLNTRQSDVRVSLSLFDLSNRQFAIEFCGKRDRVKGSTTTNAQRGGNVPVYCEVATMPRIVVNYS